MLEDFDEFQESADKWLKALEVKILLDEILRS
jgi:hypothetical protein